MQDSVSAFLFGEPFGGMAKALQTMVSNDIGGMSYSLATGIAHFQQPDVEMHDAIRVLFDVSLSCSCYQVSYIFHQGYGGSCTITLSKSHVHALSPSSIMEESTQTVL